MSCNHFTSSGIILKINVILIKPTNPPDALSDCVRERHCKASSFGCQSFAFPRALCSFFLLYLSNFLTTSLHVAVSLQSEDPLSLLSVTLSGLSVSMVFQTLTIALLLFSLLCLLGCRQWSSHLITEIREAQRKKTDKNLLEAGKWKSLHL